MEPTAVINIYLIGMSFVYLWAFSSLYFQIPGLYGDQGVLPIRSVLKCEFQDDRRCAFEGQKPTILHYFVSAFGLTPGSAMELACILGIVFSIMSAVFRPFRDAILYFILWYLYFSCCQVGQTFLWFQWDTLLLETGFLTILVAPCRIYRRLFFGKNGGSWLPYDNVNLFLIRWLSFRYMFANGIVKLSGDCPTWWSLTALHYHFESTCIPTWPAWYAHVWLPGWFKKLSVVATFVMEIFLPIFFLLPVKRLREFAFWNETVLMFAIMLTGNYNFFNALTIVIYSPLFVSMDGHSRFGSHNLRSILGRRLYDTIAGIMIVIGIGYLAHWTVEFFAVHLDTRNLAIESDVAFTKKEFDQALAQATPILMVFGCFALMMEVVAAFIRCFTDIRTRGGISGFNKRISILMHCALVSILAATLFAVSLVPTSWLHRNAYKKLWPELISLHEKTDKYQLTHSYGLFRHMTGVGGRPEVIVEGASERNGPWKEYEFLYKPGSLDRRPEFLIPHQARLDWQMWFAALDDHNRNPWFHCLMYRLLKNESDVLKLMDMEKIPFGGKKGQAKYIRAKLYLYHYTTDNKTDENYHVRNWWWREFQRDYLPMASLESKDWINWLKSTGCIIQKAPKQHKTRLNTILAFIRDLVEQCGKAEYFIWSLTVLVLLAMGLKRGIK